MTSLLNKSSSVEIASTLNQKENENDKSVAASGTVLKPATQADSQLLTIPLVEESL